MPLFHTEPILTTFILTMVMGMSAQLLANRLKMPSIVFLTLFGVLCGPEILGTIKFSLLVHRKGCVDTIITNESSTNYTKIICIIPVESAQASISEEESLYT